VKTKPTGFITIAEATDWPAPSSNESLIRISPVSGMLYAWGEDGAWHGYKMAGGEAELISILQSSAAVGDAIREITKDCSTAPIATV
jgi:hypothetical protein